MDVCDKCGLPENLCVCGEIAKESQKIKVRVFKRRFGKLITEISGLDSAANAKELGKLLKRKLACGGTSKNEIVELQGNHKDKVKEVLLAEGYKEDLIDA
ncbi:MAG: stress response translation initiation inhibitor YciH [Candidatus Diapherotrites archaeon]|nr:stress response translation initiation inhibitor YciH [Candidatus Micrarchaeota archaeon]MBU1939497.1 stress response translation initiation inhibitor YciH [Candidatus Micrarchaeota archaeon]